MFPRYSIASLLVLAACGSPRSNLTFPAEPSQLQTADPHEAAMFVPEGKGPFPAVVLLHTCAGINPHLFDWAKRLTDAGYVAMIIDSNKPRGVKDNCRGPDSPVSVDQVASDADAAMEHLRGYYFVQKDRMAVMGFSWGAMAAIRLDGRPFESGLTHKAQGLRAVVSFYPFCSPAGPFARVANYQWDSELAAPALLLLGGADDEAPASGCTGRVDPLIASGQPIRYKVYPGTTHAFDVLALGTRGREIWHGSRGPYHYRYSPDATEDSWREVRAFLDQNLKK